MGASSGNSDFTEQLFKAGYTNITNIDVSAVVINQMQQRYAAYEGVECESSQLRKPDNSMSQPAAGH